MRSIRHMTMPLVSKVELRNRGSCFVGQMRTWWPLAAAASKKKILPSRLMRLALRGRLARPTKWVHRGWVPAFVDLVTASLMAASSLGLALPSQEGACAPRILRPQVPSNPAQAPAHDDTGAVGMAGWSCMKVHSQHSGSQALDAVISEMKKRISLKSAGDRLGAAVSSLCI